ncbi:MAG: cobyrinate a,c-diamide synthase [Deltaproteobacteria bacterium]|nr:cobyrinate a,c-diamide synthase [Deltaproteobacteria bacterium]
MPRLVVAGLAGDTGKSLVALGLVRALKARGFRVAPFKKGPDFIDAAWLGAAAGTEGRNLDTFIMPSAAIHRSLGRAAASADVAIIEGNRGLYDGLDAEGTHSTATLAKLTGAPVVLVVDATKCTRTVAALVLGCRKLDPEVNLAGVVLNRVGTARQEKVIRQAVAAETDVPVLGAIRRLEDQHLPSRHLGLVTAFEHSDTKEVLEKLSKEIESQVDVAALMDVARTAPPLAEVAPSGPQDGAEPAESDRRGRVTIGVLKDRAFTFYYPENLEALEAAGAELLFLSPLSDSELPHIDALYAGGGFPEVYVAKLSGNRNFRLALQKRIAEGLPVWAECGGLAYLAQAIEQNGRTHPMVGALPVVVSQSARPQGHGYVTARVDRENPFLPVGTPLAGHEFHYTQITTSAADLATVMTIERGVGVGNERDGIQVGNVLATYTHLHALGTPGWAPALVRAAWSAMDGTERGEPARLAAQLHGIMANREDDDGPSPSDRPARARLRRQKLGLRQQAEERMTERRVVARALRSRGRRSATGLRAKVRQAVMDDRLGDVEQLIAQEARTIRHLVGLTYQPDPRVRETAAKGVALAGKYHPKLVEDVIRRLVWAMNEKSGTNGTSAPEVLRAIANEQAELLLPVVPELVQLASDEGLREGLAETLRIIVDRCPGKVGASLGDSLTKKAGEGGGCCVIPETK